jgi:hypothetical protein
VERDGDEARKRKRGRAFKPQGEAELSYILPAKIYESNTFYHIETKGTRENKVKTGMYSNHPCKFNPPHLPS